MTKAEKISDALFHIGLMKRGISLREANNKKTLHAAASLLKLRIISKIYMNQ